MADDAETGRSPRQGVRLGVDVGDVRVGIARCDPAGVLATPVQTLHREPGDIERIVALAAEYDAIEVVVGHPTSLSGRPGPAAQKVVAFAAELAAALARRRMAVSVRLVDERFTTVSAERVLRDSGRQGARRRAVVDQAAAVVILQHALDTERSTGRPPGEEVGQVR